MGEPAHRIQDEEIEGPSISRARLANRRRRGVRSRTVHVKRLTQRDLAIGQALYPPEDSATIARPRTRSDCAEGVRPCPFVSCKYHLYLDVSAKGSIKMNFPDLEPDEMVSSCSLDVAEGGESTLVEVGVHMNLTRERVRQIEEAAKAKLESADGRALFGEDDLGAGKRRLPIVDDYDVDGVDSFDLELFASPALDAE